MKRCWLRYVCVFLLLGAMTISSFFGILSVSAEEVNYCENDHHQYTVTITRMPTETEDGERTYTCDICGYTYKTSIPALGHEWSEWVIDKEATCTEDGHKYRTCTKYPDSPHTEEAVIPATGVHDYIVTMTEATCTKAGYTTYTCKNCGDTYTETGFPALGHHYRISITKEAGCDEDGIKTFTCEHCGDTYTQEIPASGHLFGEWITDKEPTKEETGRQYRVCENDSAHIEEKILPVLEGNPLNAMDVIFAVGLLGMTSAFGGAIYSDMRLIRWKNKKHRDFVKAMREAAKYGI